MTVLIALNTMLVVEDSFFFSVFNSVICKMYVCISYKYRSFFLYLVHHKLEQCRN